jgi:phage terminase large subunit GpA-like protein
MGRRRIFDSVRRAECEQAPIVLDQVPAERRDRRLADRVGKDGDPLKLVRDRTAAFEDSRKILDGSTPLIKGTSKIEKRFLAGDQRYYFVHCVKCGEAQTLRWKRTDRAMVSSAASRGRWTKRQGI